MRRMVNGRLGLVTGLVLVAVLGAACKSSSTTTGGSTPGSANSGGNTAASQPFGSDCGMVPSSGTGSFSGMMHDPVATAASHNPLLSTLAHDVQAAGLTNTLDTAQGITVFAPDDEAFKAAAHADPKGMKDMMMHPSDPSGPLVKTLTYHVVQGQLAEDQLVGQHTTLEGGTIHITDSGGMHFTVNGSANIICGNIHTSNATVYIIDHVLHP